MTPDIAALVERLRKAEGMRDEDEPEDAADYMTACPLDVGTVRKAADALTRLSADVERMSSALEPIVSHFIMVMGQPSTAALEPHIDDEDAISIKVGDLRRAKAALAPASSEGEG